MSRILVIENERGAARGLRYSLEAEGYEVVSATDGAAGLRAAAGGAFDLILLDLTLPGSGRFDTLKRLCAGPNGPPVILMSEADSEEERVRGLELGADDYVAKPFGLGELLARIRTRARSALRLAVLDGAIKEASRDVGLATILGSLVERALALTGAERGLILLADGAGRLRVEASRGFGQGVHYSTSVAARVFQTGRPEALFDTDGSQDPGASFRQLRLRRVLCAPLESAGRRAGVLYADSRVRVGGFGRTDLDLFGSLAWQCGLAIEKARVGREKRRLEREMHLAGTVQQGMLPLSPPPGAAVEIAGLSQPCEEAGGDYFDYLPRDEVRLAVVMGDAAGHGVAAALCMSAARSLVRAFLPRVEGPAGVLEEVNRGIARDMAAGVFMSLVIAEVDTTTGALRYASAGHDTALVYRAAERRIEELPPTGPALGILEESAFLEQSLRPLAAGDLLLLYTDGVSEARSPAREFFGTDRVQRAVRELCARPVPEILEGIASEVARFCGGGRARDDISLMVVKGVSGTAPVGG